MLEIEYPVDYCKVTNSHVFYIDSLKCTACDYVRPTDDQTAAKRAAEVGQRVQMWSHMRIVGGATLVRRDSLRTGDIVVSSHYGRSTVKTVLTSGTGVHGGATHLVFEGGTARHTKSERYDSDMTIPLVSRALERYEIDSDASPARFSAEAAEGYASGWNACLAAIAAGTVKV